jgi:hypothetical protein
VIGLVAAFVGFCIWRRRVIQQSCALGGRIRMDFLRFADGNRVTEREVDGEEN